MDILRWGFYNVRDGRTAVGLWCYCDVVSLSWDGWVLDCGLLELAALSGVGLMGMGNVLVNEKPPTQWVGHPAFLGGGFLFEQEKVRSAGLLTCSAGNKNDQVFLGLLLVSSRGFDLKLDSPS